MFEKTQPGRRHILFLISESRDSASKNVKANTLVEKLATDNVQIHSIHFQTLRMETRRDMRSYRPQSNGINFLPLIKITVKALTENTARVLADSTGGQHILFSNRNSFDAAFINLTNQFRSTYLISFQAPDTGSGFHDISIRLRNAPKDVIIRSRNGYRIP